MNWDGRLRYLVTVDGTDLAIQEPAPFWRGWFSHKLNTAALRYEIGVCIQTGWIVWMNGPFPAGQWPDLRIFRESLIYELLPWEFIVADRGYQGDGRQHVLTPTNERDFDDEYQTLLRARHETVNGKLKVFKVLQGCFRHDRFFHNYVMRAVVNVVQLSFENGEGPFHVNGNF
jgi:hypothetical protein